MPNNDILTMTGGLPPSAFSLSELTACDDVSLDISNDLPFENIRPVTDNSSWNPVERSWNDEMSSVKGYNQVGLDHDRTQDILTTPFSTYVDSDFELLANDWTGEFCGDIIMGSSTLDQDSTHQGSQINDWLADSVLGSGQLASEPLCPPLAEAPGETPHEFLTRKAVPAESKAGKRRSAFSSEAKAALENSFRIEPYPDAAEIASIAKRGKMSTKQVKTWFSNKRNRSQPPEDQGADITVSTGSLTRTKLTRRSLEALQSESGEVTSKWERQAPRINPSDPKLICPFCLLCSLNWPDRVDHVATHFKEAWMSDFNWKETTTSSWAECYFRVQDEYFERLQYLSSREHDLANSASSPIKHPCRQSRQSQSREEIYPESRYASVERDIEHGRAYLAQLHQLRARRNDVLQAYCRAFQRSNDEIRNGELYDNLEIYIKSTQRAMRFTTAIMDETKAKIDVHQAELRELMACSVTST
ncbi:hypothetical protein FKW77_003903 [Venturia effusa]|uniref:Homeobox domain-containing protein n=1 Tax=Venturia effusa TaxID=50376 RepID=A0A517L923_9PEZI|nr:hypothetical protein FKW77_003903 [Venturia effusa]